MIYRRSGLYLDHALTHNNKNELIFDFKKIAFALLSSHEWNNYGI